MYTQNGSTIKKILYIYRGVIEFSIVFFLFSFSLWQELIGGTSELAIFFSVTIKFLAYVSPLLMILVLFIAMIHHGLTKITPNSNLPIRDKYQTTLFTGLLSTVMGASNIHLILKPVLSQCSYKQRFCILTIGFCSSGGLTCLIFCALGYPFMHLLLVSTVLPIIAALLLPCILGADPKALPISWHIDSKSFKERLKMYFIGGYKIIFNRAALIAIFEVIGYFFKDTLYAIFKSLEYFLVSWFQLIGFFEQTSIILAEFWLLKTVSSRDLSMIKLAESDYFLTMTAGEQLSTVFIILNIACLSALCSITLNLMALLGRDSSSTIKLIPAAFITSILISHGIAMFVLLFY